MDARGYSLTRVAISAANGPRAPLFAPAVKEIFGLGGVGYSSRRFGSNGLGQQVPQTPTSAAGASLWPYVIVGGGLLAVLMLVGVIKV